MGSCCWAGWTGEKFHAGMSVGENERERAATLLGSVPMIEPEGGCKRNPRTLGAGIKSGPLAPATLEALP